MTLMVKICGLSEPTTLHAALDHGATMVGFVFFAASPRCVSPAQAAMLATQVPASVKKVGLFVDPNDAELRECLTPVSLDMIQLHGQETPQRVTEIKQLTGLPVMKALRIGTPEDLFTVPAYETVADWLLFDAKINHTLPGGTGQSFDWTILRGLKLTKPWLLAGGLTSVNLAEAVRITGAPGVDVSSGVEDAPGQKSATKITEFLQLAASL